MRIGVIGAGRVGGTLARGFVHAGHDVAIANSRDPDTLLLLADELGAHCVPLSAEDAERFADIVVLAIPFGHYDEVPAGAVTGKTVIDATNYEPERDGHVPELDDGTASSSELVQRRLAGADVVKAFNAMRWDHLRDYGHEGGALHRYGIPVSGDSGAAKRLVFDLVEELGFEPVDAGPLGEGGRKFQPGTPVYTADLWSEELHERIDVRPG
jgi:8-hydroxy-5-deazaflavin:NADPH oxidoreductase